MTKFKLIQLSRELFSFFSFERFVNSMLVTQNRINFFYYIFYYIFANTQKQNSFVTVSVKVIINATNVLL